MSQSPYDVAIIGAGIVGASCADECARRGMSVIIWTEMVSEAVPRLPEWGILSSWTTPRRSLL